MYESLWAPVLAVAVAVLVVDVDAISDPRCVRYSQGMEAQVLPYLEDCRKFIICDMAGNGQIMLCPKGLYFDFDSNACSFEPTFCTNGELAGGETAGEEAAPPVVPEEKPQPVPVQPTPPVQQPQPLPPLVKPPSGVGGFPPVVSPDAPKPPVVTPVLPIVTAPTTAAAPIEEPEDESQLHLQHVCWQQVAGTVYPVVGDCGLYVVCMGDNSAIVQRCPKGLLYDGMQQRCEFADAAFCATPRGSVVL